MNVNMTAAYRKVLVSNSTDLTDDTMSVHMMIQKWHLYLSWSHGPCVGPHGDRAIHGGVGDNRGGLVVGVIGGPWRPYQGGLTVIISSQQWNKIVV